MKGGQLLGDEIRSLFNNLVSLFFTSVPALFVTKTDPKWNIQGHLVDLVQREVKALLQSALEVALSVVRANPTVLEGLGAQLEGNILLLPVSYVKIPVQPFLFFLKKICFSLYVVYALLFSYGH